jgi:hypothetical protein
MTEDELRRNRLDVKSMRRRFGSYWSEPKPWGDDAWWFFGPGGQKVIVSYDPDSEPGTEWIHASISYDTENQPFTRYPSYADLKRLHHAVFGDGHAYQVFVTSDEHINITANVLHLWGRLDGTPTLPNFGRLGTI